MNDVVESSSGRVGAHVWMLALTLVLVQLAWTNLTGLGIGRFPLTYDTVALPRLVLAAVGTLGVWALLGVSGWRERHLEIRVDITWALLAGMALWAVASAFASDQGSIVWLGQSERLEGVVTVALYALLFGLGLQLGTDETAVRVLAAAAVAGSTLLAVHGLLQVVGLDPTDYTIQAPGFSITRAFASLDNPNFLAAHLVLTLPAAAVLAYRAKAPLVRAASIAAVLVFIAALATTASQGAWLGCAVQVALGAALVLRSGKRRTRSTRELATAVAVTVSLVGLVAIIAISSLGLDLGPTLQESGSGRLFLVDVAMEQARERPLLGSGPDTFLAAFRQYHDPEYARRYGQWSTNNNAHSWVIQYLATLGLPGALFLFCALTFGLLRGRPRYARRGPTVREDGLLTAAIWLGLAGYTVQSMFNVAMLASTVPFWVLLGVVSSRQAGPRGVPQPAVRAGAVALVVTVLCAAALGVRALAADAVYLRSRLAYNGLTDGDTGALAERAHDLNPMSVKYARGMAEARARLVYEAVYGGAATDDVIQRLYDEAAGSFDAVFAVAPNDYAGLAWYAALQAATADRLDDAELRAAAIRTAVRALELDGTAWQVQPIASGAADADAVGLARSVPALP